MRTVLHPISSWDPDVQDQQPGYCVYDPAHDVFACEPRDATVLALGETVTPGCRVGWCGPRSKVRVWSSLAAASTVATAMRCEVVTVPRWNGHTCVWGKP